MVQRPVKLISVNLGLEQNTGHLWGENLPQAQESQQWLYDRHTQLRQFAPGDEVYHTSHTPHFYLKITHQPARILCGHMAGWGR